MMLKPRLSGLRLAMCLSVTEQEANINILELIKAFQLCLYMFLKTVIKHVRVNTTMDITTSCAYINKFVPLLESERNLGLVYLSKCGTCTWEIQL